MTKTQYFAAPVSFAPIHRTHMYDNGAFVCVDVYTSEHATAPINTRYFGGKDTTPVALFAARSEAVMYVARLTAGRTEIEKPSLSVAATLAW
jgi:hypothetical protein